MTTFEINVPTILGELIDDEVIIMNFDTGIYYSMTREGADIWQMVAARLSVDDIVAKVAGRYQGEPDAVRRSTDAFLKALHRENLIRATDEAPSDAEITLTSNHLGSDFEVPVYAKYTDLEDLLLVDPIHEVDEDAGWPVEKP